MKIEKRTTQRMITDTYMIYVSEDGKEFNNETECKNYEKDLEETKLEKLISTFKIDKLDGVLPVTDNDEWRECDIRWYDVKNENDYKMIYNYYGLHSDNEYFYVPEFYPAIMCVVDDGHFADVYYMNNIIKQVKHFFNRFNIDISIKQPDHKNI